MRMFKYVILEDQQPVDGEFMSLDQAWRSIANCDRAATVWTIEVDFSTGTMSGREVTEDFVRDAFERGFLTRDDPIAREHLTVRDHPSFGETLAEHRGHIADAVRKEVA